MLRALYIVLVLSMVAASASAKCNYQGKIYKTGDQFDSSDGCQTCVCQRTGKVDCTTNPCSKELQCPPDMLYQDEGDCCPKCMCMDDQYGHGEMKQGDSFVADGGCLRCLCAEGGQLVCTSMACAPFLPCNESMQIKDEDQCCPTCKPGCYDDERGFFQLGSTWTSDDYCEECRCDEDGILSCTQQSCAAPMCPPDYWVQEEGQCCPGCRPGCMLRDSDQYLLVGETMQPDPCTHCTCASEGSETTMQCAIMDCMPCPPGSEPEMIPGQCCPQCGPSTARPITLDYITTKPPCDKDACPKPLCPKKREYKNATKCCAECSCKYKGKKYPPGPFGDKCDGCVCNGTDGSVRCTKPECPKVQCVDPVQDKDTCCCSCPNGRTCMHPKSKKVLPYGEYLTTKKEICTCAGDPWFPYAFCAKLKVSKRLFKKVADCMDEY